MFWYREPDWLLELWMLEDDDWAEIHGLEDESRRLNSLEPSWWWQPSE